MPACMHGEWHTTFGSIKHIVTKGINLLCYCEWSLPSSILPTPEKIQVLCTCWGKKIVGPSVLKKGTVRPVPLVHCIWFLWVVQRLALFQLSVPSSVHFGGKQNKQYEHLTMQTMVFIFSSTNLYNCFFLQHGCYWECSIVWHPSSLK